MAEVAHKEAGSVAGDGAQATAGIAAEGQPTARAVAAGRMQAATGSAPDDGIQAGGRPQAGIGVHMLEISRMERALGRHPGLARVFTEVEQVWCARTARPVAHYAELFAARGAVVKALGAESPGVGDLRSVSVARDEAGRPHAELSGRLSVLAEAQGVREVALSLSTTHEVAVANAVAVTDDLRPQADDTPDPAEELRATFRAARSVLDELEQFQAGAE